MVIRLSVSVFILFHSIKRGLVVIFDRRRQFFLPGRVGFISACRLLIVFTGHPITICQNFRIKDEANSHQAQLPQIFFSEIKPDDQTIKDQKSILNPQRRTVKGPKQIKNKRCRYAAAADFQEQFFTDMFKPFHSPGRRKNHCKNSNISKTELKRIFKFESAPDMFQRLNKFRQDHNANQYRHTYFMEGFYFPV